MNINEYRIKVCHSCETEPMCQHSNIEDCMRRDEEIDEDNERKEFARAERAEAEQYYRRITNPNRW